MEPVEKIPIAPLALREQKPTEIKEGYVQLFPTYLFYKIEFFADEPIISNDPESGWENVFNSFDIIALKKNIAGLEKSFTSSKKWVVIVLVKGFSNDLKIYFKTQLLAQQLFDKLQKWLITD